MRQLSISYWIPIGLLILISENERNMYVHTAGSTGNNNRNENNYTLSIGKSLNIFSRYGYLSVTMKVVARDDSEPLWVFREPTINILTNIESHTIRKKDDEFEAETVASRNTAKRNLPATDSAAATFGNFHMEFCDNLDQLVQAYLRDFHFERFDKPWRAFSASWHPETIARHFGLADVSYTRDRYSYVLLRLNRYRRSVQLNLDFDANAEDDCPSDTHQLSAAKSAKQLKFNDHVRTEINKLVYGDTNGFLMFIQRFGSHFIQSYSTGDSLYQVFVFRKSPYQQMKRKFVTNGVKQSMSDDLMDHFSQMRSVHIGEILTVSGNDTTEDWCRENLNVEESFVPYQSLLRLHTEPYLFEKAYSLLQDEALLKIQLNSIEHFIRDKSIRHWFQQALDNFIHLWDSNF